MQMSMIADFMDISVFRMLRINRGAFIGTISLVGHTSCPSDSEQSFQ